VQADFVNVADEFVCVAQPALFFSVGQHYTDFGQTTDEEVSDLLERARARTRRA
jgi:putative phosphoribosyl transferase